MAKKRIAASGNEGINMTPMIDIVFQMIIFFVCTVQLEKDAINEKIRLAMAPHGPEVKQKDPRTVTIEVNAQGKIEIGRIRLSQGALVRTLQKAAADYGTSVPVVIRGDGKTQHRDIKRVMDACSRAGIWKIKFVAIKDRAKKPSG